MRFSEAIEACMNGQKITREDWNGKGMYVWFVAPHQIPIDVYRCRGGPDDPTDAERAKGYVDIAGHFDMMNAQGLRIIGWLASQTDLASDKWLVIDDERSAEAEERGGARDDQHTAGSGADGDGRRQLGRVQGAVRAPCR